MPWNPGVEEGEPTVWARKLRGAGRAGREGALLSAMEPGGGSISGRMDRMRQKLRPSQPPASS